MQRPCGGSIPGFMQELEKKEGGAEGGEARMEDLMGFPLRGGTPGTAG